jgi:hypothetical protein
MPPKPKVSINRKTVAKIARGKEIYGLVNTACDVIAEAVEGDAFTSRYTTDRRAGGVTVLAEDQARDGALTRAVAKVGLEFKAKI